MSLVERNPAVAVAGLDPGPGSALDLDPVSVRSAVRWSSAELLAHSRKKKVEVRDQVDLRVLHLIAWLLGLLSRDLAISVCPHWRVASALHGGVSLSKASSRSTYRHIDRPCIDQSQPS
jgi:hypothetical protein